MKYDGKVKEIGSVMKEEGDGETATRIMKRTRQLRRRERIGR
jgi:hypothetical protein